MFAVNSPNSFDMQLSDKKYIESLSDYQVVEAILSRDEKVTVLYLYDYCYPLFKAYYEKFKYCVEAEDCRDFISGFYLYLMTPGTVSRRSKLSTYSCGSRFIYWLKIVLANYCITLSKESERKLKMTSYEDVAGRLVEESESLSMDTLNRDDIEIVLCRMSNSRYRNLIRFRYVDGMSNCETAELLGMSLENYYNKRRLAMQQFVNVLRKERLV